MVKDAERKLGGIERPLLRDERLDAQRHRTEARRCGETTSVREIRQEQDRVRYHA